MIYIFKAQIKHSKIILKLIREFADYFGDLDKITITEKDIQDTIFCENPKSEILLFKESKDHNEIVGYTLYFYQHSGYTLENFIYIDTIYIDKRYRNRGFGKKVMQYFCQKAINENCFRIEWNCYNLNKNAIRFYDNLGANKVLNNIQYRFNKEDFTKILNK